MTRPTRFSMLDSDGSTSAIGGYDGVQRYLGFRPRKVTGGVKQTIQLINQLVTAEYVATSDDQDPYEDDGRTEVRYVPNQKAREMGVDGLVIESITGTFEQEKQRALDFRNHERRQAGDPPLAQLDPGGWGLLRDNMIRLYEKLKSLDMAVIATIHTQRDKNEYGKVELLPGLQGSAADHLPRYWDAILYSCKAVSEAGIDYYWQVVPTSLHPHADVRPALFVEAGHPRETLPQDFGPLLQHYADHGIRMPKILVMGDSRHGKTSSLRTIHPDHETVSRSLGLTHFVHPAPYVASTGNGSAVNGTLNGPVPTAAAGISQRLPDAREPVSENP